MTTQQELAMLLLKGSGVVELPHSWPFPTFKGAPCITPDTQHVFDDKVPPPNSDWSDFPTALL